MVELEAFNFKTMVRFHPAELYSNIAQLVEHFSDKEKDIGSNPIVTTFILWGYSSDGRAWD